jgi:hypothetical protein
MASVMDIYDTGGLCDIKFFLINKVDRMCGCAYVRVEVGLFICFLLHLLLSHYLTSQCLR